MTLVNSASTAANQSAPKGGQVLPHFQHIVTGASMPPCPTMVYFNSSVVGWLIGQSVGWSVGRLVGWSVGQPAGWAGDQSAGWSVGRSVGWSVGRLVGRSVGRSFGRSVSWSVGRSVGWSVGRSVSRWLVGRSTIRVPGLWEVSLQKEKICMSPGNAIGYYSLQYNCNKGGKPGFPFTTIPMVSPTRIYECSILLVVSHCRNSRKGENLVFPLCCNCTGDCNAGAIPKFILCL
jgi:hypothetical protein